MVTTRRQSIPAGEASTPTKYSTSDSAQDRKSALREQKEFLSLQKRKLEYQHGRIERSKGPYPGYEWPPIDPPSDLVQDVKRHKRKNVESSGSAKRTRSSADRRVKTEDESGSRKARKIRSSAHAAESSRSSKRKERQTTPLLSECDRLFPDHFEDSITKGKGKARLAIHPETPATWKEEQGFQLHLVSSTPWNNPTEPTSSISRSLRSTDQADNPVSSPFLVEATPAGKGKPALKAKNTKSALGDASNRRNQLSTLSLNKQTPAGPKHAKTLVKDTPPTSSKSTEQVKIVHSHVPYYEKEVETISFGWRREVLLINQRTIYRLHKAGHRTQGQENDTLLDDFIRSASRWRFHCELINPCDCFCPDDRWLASKTGFVTDGVYTETIESGSVAVIAEYLVIKTAKAIVRYTWAMGRSLVSSPSTLEQSPNSAERDISDTGGLAARTKASQGLPDTTYGRNFVRWDIKDRHILVALLEGDEPSVLLFNVKLMSMVALVKASADNIPRQLSGRTKLVTANRGLIEVKQGLFINTLVNDVKHTIQLSVPKCPLKGLQPMKGVSCLAMDHNESRYLAFGVSPANGVALIYLKS